MKLDFSKFQPPKAEAEPKPRIARFLRIDARGVWHWSLTWTDAPSKGKDWLSYDLESMQLLAASMDWTLENVPQTIDSAQTLRVERGCPIS